MVAAAFQRLRSASGVARALLISAKMIAVTPQSLSLINMSSA